jgi:hypothetical protein
MLHSPSHVQLTRRLNETHNYRKQTVIFLLSPDKGGNEYGTRNGSARSS